MSGIGVSELDSLDKKRSREVEISDENPSVKKRRSRFSELVDADNGLNVEATSTTAAAIAAKIAENISRLEPIAAPVIDNSKIMAEKMAKAAEMQAQLAAQLASVSSLIGSINKSAAATAAGAATAEKKPAYRTLLLDAQGREIDEHGQLVRIEGPSLTLAANMATKKKASNPYLAHRDPNLRQSDKESEQEASLIIDDRVVASHKFTKGKKALKFVEAGMYVCMHACMYVCMYDMFVCV
jgi:hypothetical protein